MKALRQREREAEALMERAERAIREAKKLLEQREMQLRNLQHFLEHNPKVAHGKRFHWMED